MFREQAAGHLLGISGGLSNPERLTACATDHQSSTHLVMSARISVHGAHRQLRWTPKLNNMCTYILQRNIWGLVSKLSPSRQRAQFLLAQICQWSKCNQLVTCFQYSIPLPPFYLHGQRWKGVSCPAGFLDPSMMSPSSFSLLVEFMLPNKT